MGNRRTSFSTRTNFSVYSSTYPAQEHVGKCGEFFSFLFFSFLFFSFLLFPFSLPIFIDCTRVNAGT